MSPLTEARSAVTEALTDGVDYAVHLAVPEQPTGPSCWPIAGDTWLEPLTLGQDRVSLTVIVAVPLRSSQNDAITTDLEDRVWEAITALRASDVIRIERVLKPEASQDPNVNIATAAIEVAVHVTP